MTKLWYELYFLDTLCVALVGMNPLLWNVAALLLC